MLLTKKLVRKLSVESKTQVDKKAVKTGGIIIMMSKVFPSKETSLFVVIIVDNERR